MCGIEIVSALPLPLPLLPLVSVCMSRQMGKQKSKEEKKMKWYKRTTRERKKMCVSGISFPYPCRSAVENEYLSLIFPASWFRSLLFRFPFGCLMNCCCSTHCHSSFMSSAYFFLSGCREFAYFIFVRFFFAPLLCVGVLLVWLGLPKNDSNFWTIAKTLAKPQMDAMLNIKKKLKKN